MSRSRAKKSLRFEPTDMVPSMEFITGLSAENLLAVTGIDPRAEFHGCMLKLIEQMQLDINGPLPGLDDLVGPLEAAETSGQEDWGLTKGDQVADGARQSLRFGGPEDVLKFEPLAWDSRSEAELLEQFKADHRRNVEMFGRRCVAEEDIYTTLFHWCIDTFGAWSDSVLADAARCGSGTCEETDLCLDHAFSG